VLYLVIRKLFPGGKPVDHAKELGHA
jgi:hypothetical protein